MNEPHFRYATADDVPKVTSLIERAYRGPEAATGWASEADLLTGPRTTEAEIAALIADHDGRFVLAELADVLKGDVLVGCALIQKDGEGSYFGMFAIEPALQIAGLGKALLAKCERAARDLWAAKWMSMVVISVREELIAWYERRGYVRTGHREPFPFSPSSGETTRDFDLVELKKSFEEQA
ncbi:MAG: GNAT family N-acetyltransferase [Alphaproteobacteria bacterium]|jgi:ribosomal protein S18 acetylase RimI-like enzyme